MIAIKVNNLSKKFKLYSSSEKRALEYLTLGKIKGHNDFWALQDISFEVPNGTTVGILGQNGSGKSTLLSILAGVLPQSSGTYEVNGKVSAILELGSGFHPEFSGRDNVYMYGSIMGLTKEEIDEKFNEILHFSELDDFIDQPLRTYSSGMIVRLAFSVAVNVNCDILIVDEALAVGDAIFQHRCFQKIREMQEAGKTILYVGHDTEAVRNLCSYAMLLDGGRIIEKGDANAVVNKYHAIITERERNYNEGNLAEKGEILSEKYEIKYNFVEKLPTAVKKTQHEEWIHTHTVEVNSNPRRIIFAHPNSKIEYSITIEPGFSLIFAIGLMPEAWDKINHGVRFDINIKSNGLEKNIFSRALEPKKNKYDKGWHNFKIGLGEYYGKEVKLEFITSGTTEDLNYCLAAWGWPKIIKSDNGKKDRATIEEGIIEKENFRGQEIRYGNKKAQITKVELLDINGIPKLIFNSGEMALINIEVLLNDDLKGQLSIGYYIKNKFTTIYGTNTRENGLFFSNRKKGDLIKVKFKHYLKLGTGIYSLTTSTAEHNFDDVYFEILDRRTDCTFFRIGSDKKLIGCVDLEATVEEYT